MTPLVADGRYWFRQVDDVLLDEPDGLAKGFQFAFLQGGLSQLNADFEEKLHQRLFGARVGLLGILFEEFEVAQVVEDAEDELVLATAIQVLAEPGAPANHLPEFHIGLDRLGKDKVDHLGHIDAGVEHIHGHGNGQLVVGVFKIINELLGAGIVVVDDLAELAPQLRIHLVEEFHHDDGMPWVAGKDNAFARKLLRGVTEPVLHEVLENLAVGVLVINLLVDLLLFEVEEFGVVAAFFQLLALLFGQVLVLDAIRRNLVVCVNSSKGHRKSSSTPSS